MQRWLCPLGSRLPVTNPDRMPKALITPGPVWFTYSQKPELLAVTAGWWQVATGQVLCVPGHLGAGKHFCTSSEVQGLQVQPWGQVPGAVSLPWPARPSSSSCGLCDLPAKVWVWSPPTGSFPAFSQERRRDRPQDGQADLRPPCGCRTRRRGGAVGVAGWLGRVLMLGARTPPSTRLAHEKARVQQEDWGHPEGGARGRQTDRQVCPWAPPVGPQTVWVSWVARVSVPCDLSVQIPGVLPFRGQPRLSSGASAPLPGQSL